MACFEVFFNESVDAFGQGETNGSVVDLGRRSKVITPLSLCSFFFFFVLFLFGFCRNVEEKGKFLGKNGN